ncbi:bacteriocin uviB [Brevibacillus laterosporus]|nr:BhlA/UviB family holin-like peptide [Brevibacillus laterosporus]TPG84946.1 bacteriocin uviB [Brevibacillus laterosporus]
MEEGLFNAMINQGPYAALFIWLLFSTRKREDRQSEQSQARETKLMEHNERMVIQLERNTTTLQQIERSLAELGSDVQELKEKVG